MNGDMELEIPVKIVIALIVLVVIISFVFLVYRRVSSMNLNPPHESSSTFTISKPSFSTDDVKNYISICYHKARQHPENAMACFLLKGDVSGIDSGLDGMLCDDTSKGFLVISYEPREGVVIDC